MHGENPYKRPGSPFWQVLWIDGSGRERRASTHTTNRRIAQSILAQKRKEADEVRAGIVDRFAASRRRKVDEFVVDYRNHLLANDRVPQYVAEVVRQLRLAIAAVRAGTLGDLTTGPLSKHLDEIRGKFSAKTHAAHVTSLRAFGAWLNGKHWHENPFLGLHGAKKTDADRKFRRQGLTLEEVGLLAEAAPVRHLQTYARSHGGRASAQADEYARIGRERALLYWVAATTGLRSSELASIRWEDLHLDGEDPHVIIGGKFTKNRKDAKLPLQRFVADAIAQLRLDRGARTGTPAQQGDKVFHVPDRLPEHVRRDAMHAGLIPSHRPADRRLDFHALRHSCVRILRQLGVPPEVAQQVMRHSDIRLTLQTYGSAEEATVTNTMRNLVPVPRMFSSLCSSPSPKVKQPDATGNTTKAANGPGRAATEAS
jgi:integrase